MPVLLQVLMPYIVGGVLLLAAGLFALALWYLRRGRLEPYWRLRRDASRIGWRLFLSALILAGLALAVGSATGLLSWLLSEATPEAIAPSEAPDTPTMTPIPTDTALTVTPTRVTPARPTASRTPRVTASTATEDSTPTATLTVSSLPPTPTATPSPTETRTPTPRPSRTPSPTATPLPITPLDAGVRLPEAAAVTIVGVAARVDADLALLEPGPVLDAGLTRVYFELAFDGMIDGVAWERGLYRGEELVQGGAYLWRAGETGTAIHFFGDAAGFPAGDYAIRVTFSGRPAAELAFTLE